VQAPNTPPEDRRPAPALGRSGIPASDRELFEVVYRSMQRLVSSRDPDLEDLVQAAATEVWRALPGFQGQSNLSTWIYGVCYRVLLNHRRFWRRFGLRFTFGVEDRLVSEAPAPLELISERTRAEQLRALLGRMSDKYRVVVVLHDLEGLDVAEIAAIVRANELTVRSRLRDGRRQLRRLLELEPSLQLSEA
jgi:RNA polymerase sigma-70 factor (ECF subfamily)